MIRIISNTLFPAQNDNTEPMQQNTHCFLVRDIMLNNVITPNTQILNGFQVGLLKDEIARLKDEVTSRDNDAVRIQKEIVDMRKQFKDDLAKQSRFNAANNHSIIQLRERFDNFNERVRAVNVIIRRFLDSDHLKDIDDDPDNVKLTLLERNVRSLIQIAKTNIESTSSNVNEKEAVLSILKTSSKCKSQTLTEIVQQYVDKQEKAKAALAKELDILLDVVRGQKFTAKLSTKPKTDLKWLKSQMAVLRLVVFFSSPFFSKNTKLSSFSQTTGVPS